MFDFKNYQWRKMAKNGEKWRKMAMANLPFSFVKFAISPLAPPPPSRRQIKIVRTVSSQSLTINCLLIVLIIRIQGNSIIYVDLLNYDGQNFTTEVPKLSLNYSIKNHEYFQELHSSRLSEISILMLTSKTTIC